MKKLLITTLALASTLFAFGQTIDTDKSIVNFSVSNMKVNTVEGTLTGLKGEAIFNAEDLSASSFSATVDISTINTGNKKRDKHLLNEDFFEVETYPTLSFTSKKITQNDGVYLATGDLTIKEVTQEVEIPFTVSQIDGSTQLTGKLAISRLEYHVGEDTGTFMVGDEIEIEVIGVLE